MHTLPPTLGNHTMPSFYFTAESHTLASALRPALETANPDDFVACTLQHPRDDFLLVEAPSEAVLRTALLGIKAQLTQLRVKVGFS